MCEREQADKQPSSIISCFSSCLLSGTATLSHIDPSFFQLGSDRCLPQQQRSKLEHSSSTLPPEPSACPVLFNAPKPICSLNCNVDVRLNLNYSLQVAQYVLFIHVEIILYLFVCMYVHMCKCMHACVCHLLKRIWVLRNA